jgi:hypothetical protein
MDTEKLVAHARARFDHAASRRMLKEKYQGKFVFAHAGGMWQAGPELLTTLKCCTGDVVILDLYETPVRIKAEEFYKQVLQRWQEQLNAWLVEYETLNTNR